MKSDPFRAAAEAKDFSAIDELFAEDVDLPQPRRLQALRGARGGGDAARRRASRSSRTSATPTRSRPATRPTLAFSARVGDREVDGIDFLHFDSEGRDPTEMAVYVRPMSGVNALAEAMQPKLEEAGARTRLSRRLP